MALGLAAFPAAAEPLRTPAPSPPLIEGLRPAPAPEQIASPDIGGRVKSDCQCRHKEGRADQGRTVCILQGRKRVLARCEMAANNPIWTVIQQGCDPVS